MFKRGPLLITGTSVAMLLSAASYAAPINNAQNTQVSEAGEESTADTTVNLDQTDDGVALATAQGNSATGDFYEETAFVSAQSQAGRTAASATAPPGSTTSLIC